MSAYVDHVYAETGGSVKILSYNRAAFKNTLFTEVAKQLGIELKIYTALYHCQSNGHIKGFHAFLKACISKHISPGLEWDRVVPLACAAYNFFPNEYSRESQFFLMFGRDPYIPIQMFLKPKIRYLGTNENIWSLEALKDIYKLMAVNLKKTCTRWDSIVPVPANKIKQGDTILIKDHTATGFDPVYIGGLITVT